MDGLRIIGLSDDATGLVLADGAGQSYTVVLDAETAEAIARARAQADRPTAPPASEPVVAGRRRARPSTKETALDTLTPREIQARIRAGASVEDVARESDVSPEHIERYAGPVLAERDYHAEQAQRMTVRRAGDEMSLGAAVALATTTDGADPGQVTWDAWRRDDGRWAVGASLPGATPRLATWIFDPRARSVHPDNDVAREVVSGGKVVPLRPAEARGVDQIIPAPAALPGASATSAEASEEAMTGNPPERQSSAQVLEFAEPAPEASSEDPETPSQVRPGDPAPKGRKGRRASVPSWDEILFGAQGEDS